MIMWSFIFILLNKWFVLGHPIGCWMTGLSYVQWATACITLAFSEEIRKKKRGRSLCAGSGFAMFIATIFYPITVLVYLYDAFRPEFAGLKFPFVQAAKREMDRWISTFGNDNGSEDKLEEKSGCKAKSGMSLDKNGFYNSVENLLSMMPFSSVFTTFEVEFLFEVNNPEQVAHHYEELPESLINEVNQALGIVYKTDTFMQALGLIMLMHYLGMDALTLLVVIVFMGTIYGTHPSPKPLERKVIGADRRFDGPSGLYRVFRRTWIFRSPMGIAYAEGKVLTTLNHVTYGFPVSYDGVEYKASVLAPDHDFVAYGGIPNIVKPSDGELVHLEVVSPYANITVPVRSHVKVTTDERIIVPCIKTDRGISGSPMFTMRGGQMQYAGPFGSTLRREFELFNGKEWEAEIINHVGEIVSDSNLNVVRKAVTQCFTFPGAGKTRTVIPHVINQGLRFCRKVYVAGPTRVVAREIYNALSDGDTDVTLAIKGTRLNPRCRIVCLAHASLLSMLLDAKSTIPRDAGFIIDESHCDDARTKILLHLLRKRISVDELPGFLLELTATGIDLSSKNFLLENDSKYPIDDIPYEEPFITRVVTVARKNPSKRIIAFCPSVTGENGVHAVVTALKKANVPQVVQSLHRINYSVASTAVTIDRGRPMVIVTTSISECGANYSADIVVDSGKQIWFIREPNLVEARMGNISESQKVQRRGRVGRLRVGEYHYPAGMVVVPGNGPHNNANDFDRDIFLNVIGSDCKFENETQVPQTMTKAQALRWLDGSNSEVRGAETICLLYAQNGVAYNNQAASVCERIVANGEDEVVKIIKVGKRDVKVKWWDDRDRDILVRLLRKMMPDVDPKVPDLEPGLPELDSVKYVAVEDDMVEDTRDLFRINTTTYRIQRQPGGYYVPKTGLMQTMFGERGYAVSLDQGPYESIVEN